MADKRGNIVLKLIIYLSWIFILFVGIFDFFTNPLRSFFWFLALIILTITFFSFKHIPYTSYLLVILILLLHIFGEMFLNLFEVFFYYDKILHLINPIFASFFVFAFLKPYITNVKKRLYYSFIMVLTFHFIVEAFELLSDHFFGWSSRGVSLIVKGGSSVVNVMGGLEDTIIDTFLSVIGALLFYTYFLFKNK